MFYKTLFILLLLVFTKSAFAFSYTLKLSEADVQAEVDAQMPLKKNLYFFSIAIRRPLVKFAAHDGKIRIISDIAVTLPNGVVSNGSTAVEGGVDYRRDSGEFYFTEPEIKRLKFEHLPQEYESDVLSVANVAIKLVLEKMPVYRLDANNKDHQLARSSLKSIDIENGMLLIELEML